MGIQKILASGFLIASAVSSLPALSNEAVLSPSASVNVSKNKTWADNRFGEDSESYALQGQFTSAITGTDYLGFAIKGKYESAKYDASYIPLLDRFIDFTNTDDKTSIRQKSLEINLFARDSQIGGLLIGHEYQELNFDTRFYVGPIGGSNKFYTNSSIAKAEYYSEYITVAARYSYQDKTNLDSINNGLGLSFYPTENYKLKLIGNQLRQPTFDRKINYYQLGFESQPQYFNGKLRLYGDYRYVENSREGFGLIGADYQFSEKVWLNAVPTIGMNYSQTRDDKALMIQFGFNFDNRISLKDRDRKYLFDSGL